MSQVIEKAKQFFKHPLFQPSDSYGIDLERGDAAARIAAAKALITSAKKFEEKGEMDLADHAVTLASHLIDDVVEQQISAISELT